VIANTLVTVKVSIISSVGSIAVERSLILLLVAHFENSWRGSSGSSHLLH
jgi:hypothetical protein